MLTGLLNYLPRNMALLVQKWNNCHNPFRGPLSSRRGGGKALKGPAIKKKHFLAALILFVGLCYIGECLLFPYVILNKVNAAHKINQNLIHC